MTNKTDHPELMDLLNHETSSFKKLPFFYSLMSIKRCLEENEFKELKVTAFDAMPRERFVHCMPFYKRISKCF